MCTIKVIIFCSTSHVDLLDFPILTLSPYFFLLYHAALPGVSVWSRSNLWEGEAGETQPCCVLGSSDKNLKLVHPYNLMSASLSLKPLFPSQSMAVPPIWEAQVLDGKDSSRKEPSPFCTHLSDQTEQESLTLLGS